MIPDDLLYTKSHEWVKLEGDNATIGITHFAQEQLGDLTFIELPAEGDEIIAEEEMGTVESVKAASELYAPVTGKVTAVNQELDDNPGLVNSDPYEGGWMIKVVLTEQPGELLTADEYEDLIQTEEI